MSRVVSIERDGPAAARRELERTIAGGGVVVFPADGLYGLACDPVNPEAIRRIHRLKGRDDGKSAAVMYLAPLAMRELVAGLGPRTREAVGALLPGALTLVVANPERRYPLACRADPERLGVRLIGGPLEGVMCPLFQTSANLAGETPPAAFDEVDPALVAGADLAIDGGRLTGLPSTVVDLSGIESGGEPRILRSGAVDEARLSSLLAALSSRR